MTRVVDDVGEAVEATLSQVGNRIVLATPLGIGKPNALVNEFYRRAARNPNLSLRIVTALTLSRPRATNDLHRRYLEPLNERLFGDYVELEYVAAQRAGKLPPNIEVSEFYLVAGGSLGVGAVQQHYLSTNYTHVVRDLLALGVNVIAQSVACRPQARGTEYSLSSNPDLTLDLVEALAPERAAGKPVVMVGAINRRMPFMLGDAHVAESFFDLLVDDPRYEHDPYCAPSMPIGTIDYCIGLNASALVHDGGTLQLGIGELADAVVYGLQLRQQRNAQYRAAHAALALDAAVTGAIAAHGGYQSLERGLYACSEMFVDGFLDLYRTGVLKRGVYGHAALERLLYEGAASERIDERLLAALADALPDGLKETDFHALARAGLFLAGTRFASGQIVCADGTRLAIDLTSPGTRLRWLEHATAKRLNGGTLLHAGFLLGPRGFYSALRELPESERCRFSMTRISFTNALGGPDAQLKVAQRRHARFINTTMMASALGAATSDALDSGQVVSGVGGQYNFVAMAHDLPEARSILMLRATRTRHGVTTSNIFWSYGHTTIPRHLRDIFVTEYGIADLRGRTDRECIIAMLSIADSRFQDSLLEDAKRAGKIESGYRLADAVRNNLPQRLERALGASRADGLFTAFPFGTDFTSEEIVLAEALKHLEAVSASTAGKISLAIGGLLSGGPSAVTRPYLARMGLDAPRTFRERLTAGMLHRAVASELGKHRR